MCSLKQDMRNLPKSASTCSHNSIMNLNSTLPIKNFPPRYPWYKRLGSNITYWLSQIPLWKRRNNLSRLDIRDIWSTIRTGDVILVGGFRHISWLFIEGIVTHALSYTGRGRCVHAFAHGVSYTGLRKVCRMYDTVIILRPRWQSEEQLQKYRNNLIAKIGQPYDFFFWLEEKGERIYFCTRLVNDSLQESWYNSWLESVKKANDIIDETLDDAFRAHRILMPEEMIYGNFDVVLTSHNITTEWEKYILREGKFREIIS